MSIHDRSADIRGGSALNRSGILPVVGQAREIGFPIRLTGGYGKQRLIRQRSLRFAFVAAGTSFETRGEATGSGVAVTIRARLGLLPYSCESKPARAEAIALIAAPPQNARVRVTSGNQVVLDGSVAVDEAVTPVSLIAALAEWVVNVQPWLAAIARPLRRRARL